MRISDWSSDVCSSDLTGLVDDAGAGTGVGRRHFLDLLGAGNGSGAKHGRQQHAANGIHLVESFALKGYCGSVGTASWSRCAGNVIAANGTAPRPARARPRPRVPVAGARGHRPRRRTARRVVLHVPHTAPCWRSGRNSAIRQATPATARSEEHTSELQSLMRTSYAVFCLKQKKNTT